MKHIKLFEQFDEWDPFGEERKPTEHDGEFMIVQRLGNGFYYIAKIEGDNMIRCNDEPYPSPIESYVYPVHPRYDQKIHIYDKNDEYRGGTEGYFPWKYFYYGDLPEELKNKIKE